MVPEIEGGAPVRIDVPAVMTPDECAEFLGLSKETLLNWRKTGDGPKWSQPTDRIVRYLGEDVISWLREARA